MPDHPLPDDRTRHLEARIMVHGRPAGVVRLSVGQRVKLGTPHLREILEAFARGVGATAEAELEDR